MNEISGYLSGYVGYFAAIGVVAIVVVVFYFRRSNERYRKALEARRRYNCLSAKVAWGGDDDPAEEHKQDRRISRGNS